MVPQGRRRRSKYTVETNSPTAGNAKDTTFDGGRLHKELHSIVATYTDSTGKFITNSFINKLLESKAPKNLTERLHETQSTPALPRHSFRWGHGTKNDKPADTVVANKEEGISKHKLKIINSKYPDFLSVPQKVLRQSYGHTISLQVFEKELQQYLLETGHIPHYCAYATSLCSTGPGSVKAYDSKKYRAFNNRRAPFALGGLGGLPFVGITGMKAIATQLPPGGKVVLLYGQHVGIDDLGRLGFATACDEQSGLLLRIQSCEPIMKVYKKMVNMKAATFFSDVGQEELNRDFLELQKLVQPHMVELEVASERPCFHLPTVAYREQRKRLLKITNASIEGKGIMVGYVRIIMPPNEDDRIILMNVDVVKPRNLRKKNDQDQGMADGDAQDAGKKGTVEGEMREGEETEESWLVDKLGILRSRCMKVEQHILASTEAQRALKDSIENLEDKERAKRTLTRAKQAHKARVEDDWKLDKNGTVPIALQKMKGLAIYFRWSRMVRRLFNIVRLKEVNEDWNLNAETRKDARLKFGKLFMTMRWKGLMTRFLAKHNRLERKELLRYY